MVVVGFQTPQLLVPEEDANGNASSIDICVDVLVGVLERPLVVHLSLEDDSAIGKCLLFHFPIILDDLPFFVQGR